MTSITHHTTAGSFQLTAQDLPSRGRNQLRSWLGGAARQEFVNDPVVNAYLSRRSGPRVTRRVPKGGAA